jgi:hypothetical protein
MEIINKGKELNLTIRQGATFGPIVCTLKDSAGSPVDITGFTVRAQIRKTPFTRKATGCAATCLIVNGPAGQFSFEFLAEDTALLQVGDTESSPESQYQWDLEIEQPDTRVIPVVYGTVSVFREVTKNE